MIGILLKSIIGYEKISNVNFPELKDDIISLYDDKYKEIITLRIDAVEKYLKGNLEDAEKSLQKAVKKLKALQNYPQWILNDIAIDLRNIRIEINNSKGIITFDSEGQKILDSDENNLFNPIVDRVNYLFEESVTDYERNELLSSPYSVSLCGIDNVLTHITNSFIAAVYSVSCTHIIRLRKKMADYLIIKSINTHNNMLYLITIKLLVVDGDFKKVERFIDSYGGSSNIIDADFAYELQEIVEGINSEREQFVCQSGLLKCFGYYYSDELYNKVINQYMECSKKYERQSNLIQYILDVVVSMQHRNNPTITFSVINSLINCNANNVKDSVYKAICKLDVLSDFNKDEQKLLISAVVNELNKYTDTINDNSILELAQCLRIKYDKKAKKLDKIIEKKAPIFYKDIYSINVFKHNENDDWNYINSLIKQIHEQNMVQGKNGVTYGYANDVYDTIFRIVLIDDFVISSDRLKKIITVAEETLLSEGQTSEAKYNAVKLLLLIQMTQPTNRQIKNLIKNHSFEEIKSHNDSVLAAPQYNGNSLYIIWSILESIFNSDIREDIVSDLCRVDIPTQTAILKSIEYIAMKASDYPHIIEIIKTIWPALSILQNSNSVNIRCFVARIYARLYGTSIEKRALEKLSVMMLEENAIVKGSAIKILKGMNASGKHVEYIYQKGRLDNHYYVRKLSR